MLENRSIICFAGEDWWYHHPHSKNHIMKRLALRIPWKGDTVDFHVDMPELYAASFSFSPAIADGTLHAYTNCDWIDNAITLQMGHSEGQIYGYLHMPCKVELNAALQRESQESETSVG